MLSDIADLVLGRACLVCQEIGSQLCANCLESMRGRVTVLDASPPMAFAGPYAGILGEAIIAYKEHGHRSLASSLGILLSDALVELGSVIGSARLLIVPVPGHRRPARGFDALGGILRYARRSLRSQGMRADVWPTLRRTREHGPIKDLGREERYRHVHGTMRVRARLPPGHRGIVLVDDVITSGATTAEASRALHEAGIRVLAVGALAAVRSGRDRQPG